MNKELSKKELHYFKDIIFFCLLAVWIIIPFIKTTKYIYIINEYNYLKFIGIIGFVFLIINIGIELYKAKNKKIYFLKMLPVFVLGMYMVWTLISALNAKDINKSFLGTEYRKEGYITYIAYAGVFSLAFFIQSGKIKKILLNLFVFIATFNCLVMQFAEELNFLSLFLIRIIKNGVFYNSNHYGYYLFMATISSVILFIDERKIWKKILYIVCYILLIYYLIFNDTFGVFLATGIILILLFVFSSIKKKKIVDTIVSVLIFIIMSFLASDNGNNIVLRNFNVFKKDIDKIVTTTKEVEKISDIQQNSAVLKTGSERMNLWIKGIEFFIEKPILGYGPENLENKYAEVNIVQDRPHNLIIQLLTTSGLPGCILYLTAVSMILLKGMKNIEFEENIEVLYVFLIIGYLISAMFGNSMYYTSPYFFVFLGLLMKENIKEK